MPRQRHVTRRPSPMCGMIEIGLVDRAALAFVNRAGIAVPKILEHGRIEREQRAVFAVEANDDPAPLDAADDAGIAVIDVEALVGAGELNPVALGKIMLSVLGLEAR